jgi:hypothetical protein
MTVEVAEEDGIHRAGIPFEDASCHAAPPVTRTPARLHGMR